ncbi:NAD/ferredoxin-dependent reductase-like protein [Homoserinimonas aerilata]|uniref:NAD/ferredoxin-dependent reductase-like protein n=1 Tax=Homoserinimonas aerilata TaxID=1162970 RepID=A0A542YG45_9MICO|nr:FAD-dependent oxidoreductase [Homoserinimonas aerilata]TQL47056.1 NAD/ferredoxin-dependent reductase-like protein [Homoserinimonas aerilata]
MSTDTILIIGAGLAGATAAEELRTAGFDGTIQMLGAERHLPYLRPPLSKGYLLGKEDRDSVFVKPAEWYAENDVEVDVAEGSRVASVDLAGHHVTLTDDRTLPYDRLLLATGAQPRRLDVPGADARGIHYLRTLENSLELKKALSDGGRRVVVIGAGWIGLELAAAARGYNNEVTVVGHGDTPLAAALGTELGTMFKQLHEQNGVEFRMPAAANSFTVRDGAVVGVMTDAGELPADLVIVGAGATPDTVLAEAAGLEVDNGVLVDESLRSSDPDVFAAGDVANPFNAYLGERLRSEHWANAIDSGKVAARSILGQPAALDVVPYFYTDQYDLGMEFAGYSPLLQDARVVYRGDREKREFVAFWLRGDRLVAGMNVNVWDVNDDIKALISGGRAVDAAKLADPDAPLASAAGE